MPRAVARTVKPVEKGPLVFNGKPLVPNDHIYVSAPWDDRDGEPYLIARVLEVVQPTPLPPSSSSSSATATPTTTKSTKSASSSSSAGKAATAPLPRAETPSGKETSAGRVVVSAHELRVRVAYYFRTRDITNRYVADHRLLVAAMHADTVPASYVRGLCTVRHRDHIEELDVYKREKDTFYWHQLYDRYLHRYFDAVPTYKVQNAPADVLKHLQDGFEFVLCEVGTGSELCDAQRGCSVCCKWAAFADSVTCARCSKVFHLGCVDPPLAAKPKAGYGWSCAPCNKAYEEEVEEFAESGFRPGPPARKPAVGNAAAAAPGGSQMLHASKKGKAREVGPGVRVDPHDWRMTNGFPFRYFGMHAHAYNVMDPHDSLHPRASTRLGNKFQCIVPEWDPVANKQLAPPEPRQYFQPKRSRASTPIAKGDRDKARRAKLVEAPPRGEDDAINVIWRPTDKYSDESLAELFERVRKMAMYNTAGVDALNRALMLFEAKEGNVTETILALRKVSLGSLGHVSWNEEDRKKLADGAQQHHNDIVEIAKLLPNKKMGDVVKRYYVQVGHTLQEDEPTQPEEKATAVAARSKKTARRKARAAAAEEAESDGENSDHGSVAPPAKTPSQRKNRFCAICSTTETPKWYWCPNNISELEVKPNPLVMCENCGIRWRHYGAQYPPYGDEIKPLPDRKKKAKASSEDGKKEATPVPAPAPVVKEPTPPPPKPVIVPKPCLLCKRFEPKVALFQCSNCTISYHASCFGIDLDWDWPHEEWLCHMCERDRERKPLCLHPFCVLCPTPKNIDLTQPMTALDCMKETELSNYVHLLCAVWHRELQLGAPAIVSPVEAFTNLPAYRQTTTCILCKQKNMGTTIKCEDCSKQVHVACAWNAGFKFAFEVQPVRNKKRPPRDAVTVKFKEAEGILQPCVWCPDHHFTHAERKTYDLGARDAATKLTALQMYVRTYKGVKFPDAPLLLRQGRRLEAVLQPAVKAKSPSPPPSTAVRPGRGRTSLLATVIDEEGGREPVSRPTKKRRTASSTPVASPAPRAARAPKAAPVTPTTVGSTHFGATPALVESVKPTAVILSEPSLPLDAESADISVEVEAVREPSAELESFANNSIVSTSRRARVPKPPKHFSPPPPLPKKVPKKRKSRVAPSIESTALAPLENGFDNHQKTSNNARVESADPREKPTTVSFSILDGNEQLPALPSKKSSLAISDLSSLAALPKLPAFADMKSPHYSAAVSAPHMLEPLVYTAHTPAPTLPAQAPDGEPHTEAHAAPEPRHALDPALEALSAMAAAAAESRDAEASAAAARRAADQAADASRTTPTEQETINAFAALVGMPPRPTAEQTYAAPTEAGDPAAPQATPSNNVQPSTSSEAVTTDTQAAPVPAPLASPGESETTGTPSGRPKRKIRTPAALRETTAYTEPAHPAELSRLGHNSPRPQSPAHLEPIHAHPILDYVRAHQSAQQSFRIETPDDSDAASERFDSPAPPNLSPISSMAPFGRMLLGSPLANIDTLPIPPSADSLPALPGMPRAAQAPAPSRPPAQRRKKSNSVSNGGTPITCANCGTSDSPLFRRDSEGRQLCNSCGLYFKTHGRDRPQKVIARAIGATRMQKRKAQADQDGGAGGNGGGNGTKRSKKGGTPLPLRALPPLLPHAPSHPSPLQPIPAFAYGDFVPYGHNGSYGGPVASGSGERPSTSRTSSDGGSVLDGAMPGGGGYGSADYNATAYGGYGGAGGGMNGGHPPIPYDARPFGGQLPPLPPHLQQQQHQHSQSQPPYPPPYPTSHSQIGRIPRLDTPTDYAAATQSEDVYYDQPRGGGAGGGRVVSTVDAETLQRQALESLAAQALTFGAAGPGPAALAEARSSAASPSSHHALHSSLMDESGRPPPPTTSSTRERTSSSSSNVPRAAAADALASMNPAARLQAHDALEQRGQPSPPPSASAMPLGELFPGFSGPNAARAAAQANGASDADDEAAD